jgi:uncharacterized protein (TIGR02246 family)
LPVEAQVAPTAKAPTDPAPTPKPPAAQTESDAAVKRITEQYVKSYNAHDAKTAASFYTANAECTGVDGEVLRGRDAIEQVLADDFKAHPKSHLDVQVLSVRQLGKQTAIAEGLARFQHGGLAGAEETRYSSIHVLEDGKWLVASVREWQPDPNVDADMKQLDYLVGSWTAKGKAGTLSVTYSWDATKSFLNGKYTLTKDDKPISSGTQIFRVNPAGGLKVWTFESTGTFSYGIWTREEDRWIDETRGAMPNGTELTSTNIFIPLGPDCFLWQTTERTVNGAAVSLPPTVKVTRVKAER